MKGLKQLGTTQDEYAAMPRCAALCCLAADWRALRACHDYIAAALAHGAASLMHMHVHTKQRASAGCCPCSCRRRANSSFSGLQRISPLAPPASPGGGLKGHSRTPSFSNRQVAGGRAASFTNLHR